MRQIRNFQIFCLKAFLFPKKIPKIEHATEKVFGVINQNYKIF